MLEKWMEIKHAKGDQRAVRFSEFIAKEFGDEPFPSVATPASNAPAAVKKQTVTNLENPVAIKRFFQLQKEASEKQGFLDDRGLTKLWTKTFCL